MRKWPHLSVLVFGLNYRTAPVGLLERVAVAPEQLPKALASLTARDHVHEAVVLSTCNRVEIYAAVSRYHGAMGDLRSFLCEWAGMAPEDFASLAYDYFEERAAAHLFAVASGLDSMVVGERQIHLQVRQAFKDAQQEGSAGRMLDTLFRSALKVAKRVRTDTGISAGGASMVDAGLDAAERVLGSLRGRSVVIVGAGKMGGIAGQRLGAVAADLVVANRGQQRARRLAERVGGRALALEDLPQALASADLVVSSTGSSGTVVADEEVRAAMGARQERELVLLDLAVPRDVDPGCAAVPGVTVLDVDAVRRLTDEGATGVEVERARAIVEDGVEEFAAWTRTVQVEPTIAALRRRAETVRAAELQRAERRLGTLDEREREAVEALTRGIVARLLHDPTVRLKDIADRRGAESHTSALRELFDLPEPPGQE